MTTTRKPPIMDDPDAPPSEEELREAEALRVALENPALAHDDAEFARALALAHAPREIAPDEHRAILERALAPAASPTTARKRGGVVVRVAFGAAATAVSLAAAFALLVRAPEPVALTRPHSTQSLFHEPFSTQGGTSARIDRIATARASDLRDNQFARWGVR